MWERLQPRFFSCAITVKATPTKPSELRRIRMNYLANARLNLLVLLATAEYAVVADAHLDVIQTAEGLHAAAQLLQTRNSFFVLAFICAG